MVVPPYPLPTYKKPSIYIDFDLVTSMNPSTSFEFASEH